MVVSAHAGPLRERSEVLSVFGRRTLCGEEIGALRVQGILMPHEMELLVSWQFRPSLAGQVGNILLA